MLFQNWVDYCQLTAAYVLKNLINFSKLNLLITRTVSKIN